ncbi:MAG: hypothetical protein QW764_02860 [Desulfurococcaceae archaeon]
MDVGSVLLGLSLQDWLVILMAVSAVEFVLLLYIPFGYFEPVARKLNSIVRSKKNVLFLTYDDGRTYIKGVDQISKTGVLKGPKREEYYIIPEIPPEKFGSEIIAKRSVLEDTGSSVFFGYSGQIFAYTPYIAATAAILQSNQETQVQRDDSKRTGVVLFSVQQLKDLLRESLSYAGLQEIMIDIENRVREELSGRRLGYMMNFMYIFIGLVIVAIVLKIIGLV